MCMECFEDAFFCFRIPIYSPSHSKQNVNPKKIYCIDHALVKAIAPPIFKDYGHLLENIIFLHIRRQTEEIFYYRTEKRTEVDFLWIDKQFQQHLAQVSLTLIDTKTRKREVNSLLQAMSELSLNKGMIITLEEEDVIQNGNQTIEIIPAWKYLL
ncbi:MAG: hyphotetic protein [Candidatus Magnetoglobus multicellularis str. Araruama]|uniref:Hyphotetic protein n=1 Tax=Candidatus Magnetoglobus multicellularis str. Araruama TaxID=890399 RepID=A0A1V1NVB1_9BACT|nr:MAG: hyphotetic protein [Candidatus Magnetoglobus multicellularis str. Araruama]